MMNYPMLKKHNEIKHKINDIVYDDFINPYTSINTIIGFIIDDLIDVIDNDDEMDVELIEIYHDELQDQIKLNLKNRFHLFNLLPIYCNDELINIKSMNNFKYDYKDDKNHLIQYNGIMELLNDYDELLIEYDEKNYYDFIDNINNIPMDDDENDITYHLFYHIEKINNNKFKYQQQEIFNDECFIVYEIIDNIKLIELFYRYIDVIVEYIVDDMESIIKNYYRYD